MAGTAIVSNDTTLGGLLSKNLTAMRSVLPRHLTPERMARLVLLAATKSPKLYDCTQESLLQAVMQAATLGLEINGALGSAYLVPYGNQATLIPGYRGLCDLARRTGVVRNIEARIVYKGDLFDVQYGTDPSIRHEPDLSAKERGSNDIVAVYAVAVDKDGNKQFEVMTFAETEAIRMRSRSKDNGPWKTDDGEMRKKTVVRRLMKYLPLSPEVQAAIELGDRADTGKITAVADLIDTTANLTAAVTQKTNARLKELRGEATPTKTDGDAELQAELARQDAEERAAGGTDA